ncbi:MAG: hypothetical protein JJ895_05585 [Balneolaceae bacterium]|nr:hypothetical protein [Balneolaceae bacterium]
MKSGKQYTGIVLEADSLKFAVIQIKDKKVQLVKIDRVSLVEKLDSQAPSADLDDVFGESSDDVFDLDSALNDNGGGSEIDLDDDLLGGLDDDILSDLDDDILGEIGDDIDLEIDELEKGDEIVDVDEVDETEGPISNEIQVFNFLSELDPKRVDVGLNIPAGTAIFQVLKDVDFNEVKKKDLKVIIDDRLEALYGDPKDQDFYSYGVRDDGALVLSSIDEQPMMLSLIDRVATLYRGKIFISEILPDESILLAMVKANYELDDEKITCVLQFSELNCRVIFMKGDKLWLVSPIITEGVRSRKFLNTVFSKILFQLDTGEVPNLDRLIICNNSLGEEGISFFKERFPDVEVSEFEFAEEYFDPQEHTLDSIAPFTTAIGTAWAASKFEKDVFSGISFLPKYVVDRQKIFKLQWHGFVLLLLVFFSIPGINLLWQQHFEDINRLESEISLVDTQLQSYAPTVNNYNRISSQLSQIQDNLVLMNTLAENSITWSVNLHRINSGIDNIGGVWLTNITPGDEPNTLEIQGIARYRDRVGAVAELFADATLLDVTRAEIREVEVYNFSYYVNKIVANTDVYTPQNLQGMGDLIGN